MTKKWGNKVLWARTSKISLGYNVNMDAMQALDVCVEATTSEQACEVLTYIYMHVEARTRLVGYIKTLIDFRLYFMCCAGG